MNKVIQSGLAPKPEDDEVLEKAAELSSAIFQSVNHTLQRIRKAEAAAIERLEAYVPQERLLTLKEAAAYLHFSVRAVDGWTRGDRPLVQFRMLGGEKRFRKQWLDNAVDNGSVRPRKAKL